MNLYGFVGNNGVGMVDKLGRGIIIWDGQGGTGPYPPNPSEPNIIDQTIAGPPGGSELPQERYFEQEYPEFLSAIKAKYSKVIDKKVNCTPRTSLVSEIASEVAYPVPQSYWRSVAELGRVAIKIVQPIRVDWVETDSQSTYHWKTQVEIWDTPGVEPDNGYLYYLLGPGVYETDLPIPWGFPIFDRQRSVRRGQWDIEGSGECCRDPYFTL
jgi:hypothetical protein